MEVIEYSNELRDESKDKKLYNINSFSKLDRSELSYRNKERRLLMREFPTGEKLFIQYPGKETISTPPKPWDFRPKMRLADGDWMKDLSFKDVWGDLYSMKDSGVDMSLMATVFFRMAYMLDSKLVTRRLRYEDVDGYGDVVGEGEVDLEWYEFSPDEMMLNDLNIATKDLRGCNLLPYLAYNDYLAQNEDCKYFYTMNYINNKAWDGKIGRTNTLLTHMSVVAFIEGYYNFTEIMVKLQHGVAPLEQKRWEEVTGGRVSK